MRIVYDYASGQQGRIFPPPEAKPGGRDETVLVISRVPKGTPGGDDSRSGYGSANQGLTIAGTDYELNISDEALQRNQEVRAHEQAHLALLGGAAASPITYDTITGPGGERIAVGGKIAVDLSEVPGNPEETLRKAKAVIAAAYAPADPSAADQRTAAEAYRLERKAAEEMKNDSTSTSIEM